MNELFTKLQPLTKNTMRIVIGFLFWGHGAQKLLGLFTENDPVQLLTLRGAAGMLEFFGGLAIVLGLFTRPVAFVLAGEMAFAYFISHFPRGFWPWENGGERAVMYCFVYLYIMAWGGGAFSLDGMLTKRQEQAPT